MSAVIHLFAPASPPKKRPAPRPKMALQAAGASSAPTAPLSAGDQRNLRRVIWLICGRKHMSDRWVSAVWRALRLACTWPAPAPLQVRHRPIIAAELRRIFVVIEAYHAHRSAVEAEICQRVLRHREDAAPVIASLAEDEAKWRAEREGAFGDIAAWAYEDIDRFEHGVEPIELGNEYFSCAELEGGVA